MAEGFGDADMGIYVTAEHTNETWTAWAAGCYYNSDNRPTLARINFNADWLMRECDFSNFAFEQHL